MDFLQPATWAEALAMKAEPPAAVPSAGGTALRPDELIAAVHVPPAAGPQQFAKVGTRNAMVIAVVSFALHLDVASGRAGTGIGSAGPTPLRAEAAERFLESALAAGDLHET